jgi:DNA helicase-2/ATP-dependent DNA helicase PcrA
VTTRAIPAHFTPQQRAFLTQVQDTDHPLYLRATAGAGKTTTLVEAAWHLPQHGVLFAYNKHAVTDLQPRLPERLRARTLHAHGLKLLRQAAGNVQLTDEKAHLVAGLFLPGRQARHAAARAWQLAREFGLLTPTPAQADHLATRAEWTGPPDDLRSLIPEMHEAGTTLWTEQAVCDYTDMLWLPLHLGYGQGSLPLALVDEAQDLTVLRQQFVLHQLGWTPEAPGGRLIFVGDTSQAIYTWAGADPGALARLQHLTGATELPLSVSFRCPREVVRYARAHSDFIQPAPGARAGTVEHINAATASYDRGDVVLCRTNAPLIRLALDLMTQRLSVCLTGRDLEARLREGLEDLLPAPGTFQNDDVIERVRAWLAPRVAPVQTRAAEGDRAARRQLTDLHDLARCLRHLAWGVSRRTGEGTLEGALALLAELCREDKGADVLLSSVHRAKGKEWPRVTVLYPEMMPMPQGDPEEERAVQFVAITRAQDTLRFAYGKDAWTSSKRVAPGLLALEDGPAPSSPTPEAPPEVTVPQSQAALPAPTVVLHVEDDRAADALYGGDHPIPPALLRERLVALAEEDRALVRAWAQASLTRLVGVDARFIGIHVQTLALYERAASQARIALPAFGGSGVPVCVFEAPLPRVRLARKVRVGKRTIRLSLGGQELQFHSGTGELLEVAGPLSPYILPAALSALRAS